MRPPTYSLAVAAMARTVIALCLATLAEAVAPSLACAGGDETCARVPRGDGEHLLLQKFRAVAVSSSGTKAANSTGRASASDSSGSAAGSQPPLVWHRDPIHLRAHTGSYIAVQDERVHAEWNYQGSSETFTIELKCGKDRIVRMGDVVYLRAHTGKRLTVDGDEVNAKSGDERSAWQEFVVEPSPPPQNCDHSKPWYTWSKACHEAVRELRDGDAVFLRAHTGKRLTLENTTVQAKWEDQGHWQTFTVQKTHKEEPSGKIFSQCECCGCDSDDSGDEGVCVPQAGGATLVTDLDACLEAYKHSALDLGDHCPPGSHWVGIISSPWYPSGCFLTKGSAEGCEWWNIGFNALPLGEETTTCCGDDIQVCWQPGA